MDKENFSFLDIVSSEIAMVNGVFEIRDTDLS